jgi:predicted HicB family RNase H-like nuclease
VGYVFAGQKGSHWAEAVLEVMSKRRIARPPEEATATCSAQVRLRMPRSLHERLARTNFDGRGRSLNRLVLTLLAEEAGAEQCQRAAAGEVARRAA